MRNDFLEYYGKHNISPVKQDISNMELHYERRKKLYRQCGIPALAFRNADVLEVGPGGGYNTLAFFHWNSKHIDLVEANAQGIKDMQELFARQNISQDKYEIFSCKIEDYQTDKKYDIVIAECFLSNIYNQQEVISKLQEVTADNGIVVITCSDDVSFFIEIMKRLVGRVIVADISEYNEKVKYLSKLFAPQLAKLRGVSRSPEDWVRDQILNPATVNGTELTLMQAIDYFGDSFDVLGCSPRIFTDYSWYKDVWYDYKADYKEQFAQKRLSLLMANMPEVILPIDQADILVKHFENVKRFESEYEQTLDIEKVSSIVEEMNAMEEILNLGINENFIFVFYEIKEILKCILNDETINMDNYSHFFSSFGRTMQYISFVKK